MEHPAILAGEDGRQKRTEQALAVPCLWIPKSLHSCCGKKLEQDKNAPLVWEPCLTGDTHQHRSNGKNTINEKLNLQFYPEVSESSCCLLSNYYHEHAAVFEEWMFNEHDVLITNMMQK